MAVTPYIDLASQDILSAHISGLSHSVKKIEEILNMKTGQSTFNLYPVTDQEEVSLRYRIYEGTIRNWLSFTVQRNGQPVDSSEYVAQEAFGVIVFHTPQAQTDQISVNATYIIAKSTRIEGIESNISTVSSDLSSLESTVGAQATAIQGLQSDVSTLETTVSGHTTDIQELQQDVQELQANSGGSSGGGSTGGTGGGITIPLKQPTRSLYTNIRPDKTTSDLTTTSANLLMALSKIDAVPFIVDIRTKISRLQIIGGTGTPANPAIMGIYRDARTQPADLIAQTAVFTMAAGNLIKDLTAPVYLDPGLYWIARWGEGQIRLDGHKFQADVHITFEPVSAAYMDGTGDVSGVRSPSMSGLTSLPSTFPSVGVNSTDSKYLARADIADSFALV